MNKPQGGNNKILGVIGQQARMHELDKKRPVFVDNKSVLPPLIPLRGLRGRDYQILQDEMARKNFLRKRAKKSIEGPPTDPNKYKEVYKAKSQEPYDHEEQTSIDDLILNATRKGLWDILFNYLKAQEDEEGQGEIFYLMSKFNVENDGLEDFKTLEPNQMISEEDLEYVRSFLLVILREGKKLRRLN